MLMVGVEGQEQAIMADSHIQRKALETTRGFPDVSFSSQE